MESGPNIQKVIVAKKVRSVRSVRESNISFKQLFKMLFFVMSIHPSLAYENNYYRLYRYHKTFIMHDYIP